MVLRRGAFTCVGWEITLCDPWASPEELYHHLYHLYFSLWLWPRPRWGRLHVHDRKK